MSPVRLEFTAAKCDNLVYSKQQTIQELHWKAPTCKCLAPAPSVASGTGWLPCSAAEPIQQAQKIAIQNCWASSCTKSFTKESFSGSCSCELQLFLMVNLGHISLGKAAAVFMHVLRCYAISAVARRENPSSQEITHPQLGA